MSREDESSCMSGEVEDEREVYKLFFFSIESSSKKKWL